MFDRYRFVAQLVAELHENVCCLFALFTRHTQRDKVRTDQAKDVSHFFAFAGAALAAIAAIVASFGV